MNIALVLAGGMGNRAGDVCQKQYIEVNGKPMIAYCIQTLTEHLEIAGIWIVADEAWHKYILEHIPTDKFLGFSIPGDNRQLSIWSGLQDMQRVVSSDSLVLIHDAARPFLMKELISDCFEAVVNHEGVLPILPIKDTVYLSNDGISVSSLLDRNRIFAGQAPELFQFGKYYEANKRMTKNQMLKVSGSTEPAIIYGMDIVMIPGDEKNIKITTQGDVSLFRRMVEVVSD